MNASMNWSSFSVLVMACHLWGTNALSESVKIICQLDVAGQILIQENAFENIDGLVQDCSLALSHSYLLLNITHFVETSMCWLNIYVCICAIPGRCGPAVSVLPVVGPTSIVDEPAADSAHNVDPWNPTLWRWSHNLPYKNLSAGAPQTENRWKNSRFLIKFALIDSAHIPLLAV